MGKKHNIIIFTLAISMALTSYSFGVKAAETASLSQPIVGESLPELPFHKGVNINAWFDRPSSQVDMEKITEKDFDFIKSLGMDVVRLPINFHSNIGSAPDYKLDEGYLVKLDEAVNCITSRGLWVILDHHSLSVEEFPSDGEAIITECCKQLALRYKGRDRIVLELFNEPFGDYLKQNWPAMQGRIIKAVRACDPQRILIATPWGCYPEKLSELPEYDDPRVVYTFHYYNPLMFTHQEAYWDENLKFLSGYSFPYNASHMPTIHPRWQEEPYLTYLYNRYPEDATVEKIREEIGKAADWAAKHDKLLFCGEFGVLNTSEPDDRYRWYKAVSEILSEKDIPWTLWQYKDEQLINFSIFNGTQIFDQIDTDLMEALGVTLPDEFTAGPHPLVIYRDAADSWCNMRTDRNVGEKYLNYYCKDNPAEGIDCIYYNIVNPTGGVWFEMWLPANARKLYEADANFEFMARTKDKFKSLEIYFQQYRDGAPHQWRMSATLSSSGNASATCQLTPDGEWHKISIPLSDMQYHGCDGEWKDRPDPGEDGFDWGSLNWLMITPNGDRMASGKTIYIDDIKIITDSYHTQNLYFTGDPSGWNFLKMENQRNGRFSYKGHFDARDSFCFTTKDGEAGWSAKIAPAKDITFGFAEFTDNTLISGSDCAIRSTYEGFYNLSVDLTCNTLTTSTYNPDTVEKLFVECNGIYNEMTPLPDGTFEWTGVADDSFVVTPKPETFPRYIPAMGDVVIPDTGIFAGSMAFNITANNNVDNRWITRASAEYTINVNPTTMTLSVEKEDTSIVIDSNSNEERASEVFYDLLGRIVQNPSNGLYIRRNGPKTSKVVLNNTK